MPSNLSTTVDKVMNLANQKNSKLILKFLDFMKENGASERHQNNNLKTILAYSQFINSRLQVDINSQEGVTSYLQTKINPKRKIVNKSGLHL